MTMFSLDLPNQRTFLIPTGLDVARAANAGHALGAAEYHAYLARNIEAYWTAKSSRRDPGNPMRRIVFTNYLHALMTTDQLLAFLLAPSGGFAEYQRDLEATGSLPDIAALYARLEKGALAHDPPGLGYDPAGVQALFAGWSGENDLGVFFELAFAVFFRDWIQHVLHLPENNPALGLDLDTARGLIGQCVEIFNDDFKRGYALFEGPQVLKLAPDDVAVAAAADAPLVPATAYREIEFRANQAKRGRLYQRSQPPGPSPN